MHVCVNLSVCVCVVKRPFNMQYSPCHQLKQLNRVFKGGEAEEDRRKQDERESRQRQRKKARPTDTRRISCSNLSFNEGGNEDKG